MSITTRGIYTNLRSTVKNFSFIRELKSCFNFFLSRRPPFFGDELLENNCFFRFGF